MSEYNKRGVVLDHNFPVMPIILMACAIFVRLTSGGALVETFIFHGCAILIIMGMILHRLNLQLLTGIGTLGYAAYNLYSIFESAYYISRYGFDAGNFFFVFISLLAFAAYVVSGLHYVIRRPKPGKPAKLILMIPLACLWMIYGIVLFFSALSNAPAAAAFAVLLKYIALILMSFALMVYTPFREA